MIALAMTSGRPPYRAPARPQRRPRNRSWAPTLVALFFSLATAEAAVQDGDASVNAEARGTSAMGYEVRFEGLEKEPDLLELIEGVSQLRALKDRPPATRAGLASRARSDLERLSTTLRSEGFYGHDRTYRIERDDGHDVVRVIVAPGPVFVLADYRVAMEPSAEPRSLSLAELSRLDLYPGMPARAAAIVAAERRLLDDLKNRGHPFAAVENRDAVVDHAAQTLVAEVRIDPGPAATFGEITFEGLVSVEEDYLRRHIAWPQGDLYDQRKVSDFRRELLDTGLFASVEVASDATPEKDGSLPFTVIVTDAKHRSIGAGASFSTSEGFGVSLFWEHRNLFGRQERLRLRADLQQISQRLSANVRKPGVLHPKQDFLASLALSRQDNDAFDERAVQAQAGFERRLDTHWRFSEGLVAEFTQLDDNEGQRKFVLFGYAPALAYDSVDDILDPKRGSRFRIGATPYIGTLEREVLFVVNEAEGDVHAPLTFDERWVAAARARLGSIVGEATGTLPASKRFYAGGGGSIRGFEFQSAGPLDAANDPLGGRSVVELGFELRARLTETFGAVAFVDGGNVFDEPYPDLSRDFLWAAGVGVRYFTPVGPLRLDIAFPLNRRSGVDDVFQVYVSFGQAF